MPSKHKYPTIRLNSGIYAKLSTPDSASASKSLDRYFWLIESSKPELSKAELNLLCDVCNGWFSSGESPEISVQGLAMQVEDAITENQADLKWKVEARALITKLRSLSFVETFALIEDIEKFWSQS